MQNYTQMFSYDELGNLQTMQSQGRWSRSYIYDNVTNRLLRHEGTNNVYTYDAHGNMTSMPHLSSMTWNSSDMLRSASNGTFSSYYSYNAAGDRVRKGVDNGITLSTATNSIRYQYDNHLGSASLELDQIAAIISYEEYHPFGTTSYRSGRKETEVSQKRYKYVGKERDEETGLYYYGARYYAAWLCRFVSVDSLMSEFPWQSSYLAFDGNPINKVDLTGMSADWFQNEKTGEVYYNSEMRKGDEGTGAMTGKGWVHMGENGMFQQEGNPMTSDASILFRSQGLGRVSKTENYDKSPVWEDAKVISIALTGMFRGDNAQKLMNALGYDFKPFVFNFHSDITTEYHPEPHGQVTITHDNSAVESVLSSRYISKDLVLKNILTLRDYKNPKRPEIKHYGPMYSVREQSWTIRQNVYGASGFEHEIGWGIKILEKVIPWKSVYEDLWRKN